MTRVDSREMTGTERIWPAGGYAREERKKGRFTSPARCHGERGKRRCTSAGSEEEGGGGGGARDGGGGGAGNDGGRDSSSGTHERRGWISRPREAWLSFPWKRRGSDRKIPVVPASKLTCYVSRVDWSRGFPSREKEGDPGEVWGSQTSPKGKQKR